jgi:hypothetical protein
MTDRSREERGPLGGPAHRSLVGDRGNDGCGERAARADGTRAAGPTAGAR